MHNIFLFKRVHDKSVQCGEIPFVRLVLPLPLIVDIRQEVGVFKVVFKVLRIAEILCWHEIGLHKITPCVTLKSTTPCLAPPVVVFASGKGVDAVVLASKGHEVSDRGSVAALNEGTYELAALRKSKSVCGRSF